MRLGEPPAELDHKLREDMQLEVRRIRQELGMIAINVTRDRRDALVVSDEIHAMDGGGQQPSRPPPVPDRP